MKSLKRISSFMLCCLFVLGALANTSAMAATPEQIEASIEAGIEWLVDQQDVETGQWQDVPRTGFVLIKLQDRAYELGKDPFETDPGEPDYYEYATNVIKGWEYLFAVDGGGNPVYALKQNISDQDHTGGASGTVDDPDTRVNGYGIYFTPDTEYDTVYSSGICLMALAASRAPGRVNDGGIDYDGDGNADTFGEIAQDVVDWLAFAQADVGTNEGAYSYEAIDNGDGGDNSCAGYAYLGLAAAEGFGCTVPDWVKTELDVWIDYIQNDQGIVDDGGEPTPDGGSGYYMPSHWVNELKTGNLIFEMTFYGDDPSVQRFQDAMDYIERHWRDANLQPGWGYSLNAPVQYQAMYCLMKGLEYSLIGLIDLDGDNTPEHDWFDELATVLLAQQQVSGSWPNSPCYVWTDGNYGTMSGEILSTVWALLTLEKITPPPPVINLIEGAIAEKEEALERIDAALEKELVAYETLEQLLKSGDYGDWSKQAILGARWKISIAIFYEEDYIKKVLEKNIDTLRRALSALGIEPHEGNNSYMAESNTGAHEAAVLSLHELVINLIEEAIIEKAEALERIDTAIQKEQQAHETLEQMLESGDYGDWSRQAILRAKSRIYVVIKYEEYLKKVLTIKTINELEDSLSRLGVEAYDASD